MSNHMKETEVRRLSQYHITIALKAGAAQHLLDDAPKIGYTYGGCGWNYDVYLVYNVLICAGYRRQQGIDSPRIRRITAKYEHLAGLVHYYKTEDTRRRRYGWKHRELADWQDKIMEDLRARWTSEIKRELVKH